MGFLDALRRKPVEDDYYEYDDYNTSESYDYADSYAQQEPQGIGGVQPIQSMADMEIIISAPTEYKDAVKVADDVRDMKFVVLNLSKMETQAASRLLDFISGVAYSEDSRVQRVATSTYVVVPYFVDLMGVI